MTMQEWKARINGFFQPKSQAERQKMMKDLRSRLNSLC